MACVNPQRAPGSHSFVAQSIDEDVRLHYRRAFLKILNITTERRVVVRDCGRILSQKEFPRRGSGAANGTGRWPRTLGGAELSVEQTRIGKPVGRFENTRKLHSTAWFCFCRLLRLRIGKK
ncbi:hypothetical protein G5I_08624 [Acromyrmex echinatior]|uniref:Uncharacterized protein n=1 Tax=Acromyrmex echinatior TaxID=103372 RepID=F4WS15_ACREC|nr:hypothetical protein G5I_08624 [Acromyrmex echinatior]